MGKTLTERVCVAAQVRTQTIHPLSPASESASGTVEVIVSGYYTRSGYVPGPVCKYNWTKTWDLVKQRNSAAKPPARIFSYLTKDDGEQFPGKLACENRWNFLPKRYFSFQLSHLDVVLMPGITGVT